MRMRTAVVLGMVAASAAGLYLAVAAFVGRESNLDILKSLADAQDFELLSLDPASFGQVPAGHQTAFGWEVLGSARIGDAKTRSMLITTLASDIFTGKESSMKCFQPRHAIRAVQRGRSVTILICFQCKTIHVYFGSINKPTKSVLVNDAPEGEFDRVLRMADVRLAEKVH